MSIKNQLQTVATDSLRQRASSTGADRSYADLRLNATRSAIAAVQTAEKAKGAKLTDGELNDDAVISIIRAQVKQRLESSEIYRKAGEDTRAAREKDEAEVLALFTPKQLNADDTRAAIAQIIDEKGLSGKKGIGQVMGSLDSNVDKGLAARIARELLG